MPAPAQKRLSKSRFTAGVQCLKRLYFKVHQPELAEEAGAARDFRLEQGNEAGQLAQRRFPGGVLVDFGPDDLASALKRTATLMADRSVPAIFEGTFRYQGVLVRADVLQRRTGGRWRLIEVKSSVELKDYHVDDAAIQYYVLRGCGVDLSSVCVMHLNRDYVFDGLQYDPRELFLITNVTGPVKKRIGAIPRILKVQREALAGEDPPEIEPGPQCSNPFECEFFRCCSPEPPEGHISFLPGLREKKRRELADLGIDFIGDIPDDFPLSDAQQRAWTAVRSGQPWISPGLAAELSKLRYPLYFMDFETFNPAVPRYAGLRPYSQIPFQWSVHRQEGPGTEPEHYEFLADIDCDPRRKFINSLCAALGDAGVIVSYNAGFESQRLNEIAGWLPEYSRLVRRIQLRLWDLLPVVRRHVYHPEFHGSFSLKAVLPALVPSLTYRGMEVADGGEAGLAWNEMVRGNLSSRERKRLRLALLAYCKQDTLSMVKIIERLQRFASRAAAASG